MIPHTKAFATLKEEAQQTFDFAIVVCYAVPSLKYCLKSLKDDDAIPFRPDFFDSRPIATAKVRSTAAQYKEVL